MRNSTLTEQQKEMINAGVQSGLKVREIAEKVGVKDYIVNYFISGNKQRQAVRKFFYDSTTPEGIVNYIADLKNELETAKTKLQTICDQKRNEIENLAKLG